MSRLLAAGVAAYAVALLVFLPAERLRGPLADAIPDLDPGTLHGTVWSGHAGAFRGLATVHWRVEPGWLLLGRVAARVDIRGDGTRLALLASRAPWSPGWRLDDVTGEAALAALARVVPALPAGLPGRLRLDDVRAELDADGWPVAVGGRVALAGLPGGVLLNGSPSLDGERLRLPFTSPAGVTPALDGTLGLGADGGYRLALRVDRETAARWQLAGSEGADGRIAVAFDGLWRAPYRR